MEREDPGRGAESAPSEAWPAACGNQAGVPVWGPTGSGLLALLLLRGAVDHGPVQAAAVGRLLATERLSIQHTHHLLVINNNQQILRYLALSFFFTAISPFITAFLKLKVIYVPYIYVQYIMTVISS